MFEPVIFEIGPFFGFGPFALRWYALAYVVSLLIGWRYCLWHAKRTPRLVSRDQLDDFFIWAILGVSSRWPPRLHPLLQAARSISSIRLKMLKVWEGGMSFHGGLVGVILAMILFTRRRKLPFFALADIVATATPIGLFFGRLANFQNGELYGRITDVPWAMKFPGDPANFRHPSQLYEAALEGLDPVRRTVPAVLLGIRSPEGGHALRRVPRPAMHLSRDHCRAGPRTRPAACLPAASFIPQHGAMALDSHAALRTLCDRHRQESAVAMTPLGEILAKRIRLAGPMTVAEFMAEAVEPPAARLLQAGRCLRLVGRFHHLAGDQPDVRRADRRLVRRLLGQDGPAQSGAAGGDRSRPRHADGRPIARHANRCGISRCHRSASGGDQSGATGTAEVGDRQGCASAQAPLARRLRRGAGGSAAPSQQRILRRAADPSVRAASRPLAGAHGDSQRRWRWLCLCPARAGRCIRTGAPADPGAGGNRAGGLSGGHHGSRRDRPPPRCALAAPR